MALAIIGGLPERFAPFAELHRRAGHDPVPALSINGHGYIAPTSQQAVEESFPYAAAMMNRIGRERGWRPMTRTDYEAGTTLRGAYFVGSPQQVVEKILFQHEIFHHQRFLVQFSVGPVPHEKILRCIELLGTQVAPAVWKALGIKQQGRDPSPARTTYSATRVDNWETNPGIASVHPAGTGLPMWNGRPSPVGDLGTKSGRAVIGP